MVIDIWKYSDTDSKVYTDSARLIKFIFKLLKTNRVAVSYLKNGKPIAWDLVVPDKHIPRINSEFKSISRVEKKSLNVKVEVKPPENKKTSQKAKTSNNLVAEFFTIDEPTKKARKQK